MSEENDYDDDTEDTDNTSDTSLLWALVLVTGRVLGQEALTPASLVLVAPSQVHPSPTRYQAARNLVLAVARGRALVLVTVQIPGPKILSQVHPTPTQVRTPELDRRTLAVGLIRTQGNQR